MNLCIKSAIYIFFFKFILMLNGFNKDDIY